MHLSRLLEEETASTLRLGSSFSYSVCVRCLKAYSVSLSLALSWTMQSGLANKRTECV